MHGRMASKQRVHAGAIGVLVHSRFGSSAAQGRKMRYHCQCDHCWTGVNCDKKMAEGPARNQDTGFGEVWSCTLGSDFLGLK